MILLDVKNLSNKTIIKRSIGGRANLSYTSEIYDNYFKF